MDRNWFTQRIWPGLLVCVVVATGCAHGFDEGVEALGHGDDDKAEAIADDALDDDADTPWANQLKAEVLASRDDHRDALPYARQADESEAFPVRTPRLKGQIYMAIDRPADAVEAYERARQADAEAVDDDTVVEALTQAVAQARMRSDHRQRWEMISRLAELASDHPVASPEDIAVARRSYALELRGEGQYLDAIDLLRQALDDDPEILRGEALDLGELYARIDMPENAAEAWQVYLDEDVDPDERIQRHLDVAETASRHNFNSIAVDTLAPLADEADGAVVLKLAYYQLRADQRTEARRTIFEYLDSATDGASKGQASPVPFRRAAELASDVNDVRLSILVLERGIEEAEPSPVLTRELADIYARRAQLDDVEQTLELYISRREDTDDAAMFAGEWAKDRNNFELAKTYFGRVVDGDDPPSEAWLELARSLGELDEHDEMARTLHAYVDEHQGSDTALGRAADIFSEHRRYEEAESLLERLHARRPHSRRITRQFAQLYHDWSRPGEAADVWDRWVVARGEEADDLASVASVLARQNNRQRASRYYERAAEQGKTDAWLSAADLYLQQDHRSAMVRALESYLDDHPDRSRALEDAADRYRRADMNARKIDVLVELIDRHPDRWRFHQRLTALLLDQGRGSEAFDHLRRFVDHSDDPVRALDQISTPTTSAHPPAWLLDFYQSWLDDPRVRPAIYRHIGDAYYELSNDDSLSDESAEDARRQARHYYLEFLDATDGDDENWRRLANHWRRNEMWRPAAIAFERYADENPRRQLHSVGYAETLLHLGKTDRAIQALEHHFQHEQRRPNVARRIADLLVDFNLHDEAESFAAHLFLSGDDHTIDRGFHRLADIHIERENPDQLQELVRDYVDRASNTNRARRSAVNFLEDTGHWEMAAEQLGELDISTMYQHAIEMGHHYYRAGDTERSWRAFEEAAHHAPEPESTWVEAGSFLEARADHERATNAFDLAVQANPDDSEARMARGTFAIARGDVDAGWNDYQFARNASDSLSATQRAEFFEALARAGHFPKARRVIEHIEDDGLTAPGTTQRVFGRWDLRDLDGGSDDAVDHIRAGTWGQFNAIQIIDDAGRHDVSLDLIEDEFHQGDPTTAAALLLNQAPTMSRLVGWDTKKQWLRSVVDPLERSDTNLIGPVGDHRARSGQTDDARLYLQSAVDHGDDVYSTQLGHILLLTGERQEAFRHFETWFYNTRADADALESILLRFELTDDVEGAHQFLARIGDEPSLVDITLPYQIHYALEAHGDAHRAISEILSTLHRLEELPASAFRDGSTARTTPGQSKHEVISSALIRSLETVAALGYIDAVDDVLRDESLPEIRPHQLRTLRIRLALADGRTDEASVLATEILDGADGAQKLQTSRLDLAETFLSFGATDEAHQLVDAALDEQSDFRSHAPFALHLGLLTLDDDPDLDDAIDEYLEEVPNRRHARSTLIDELHRLGRDAEAMRLARDGAEQRPTEDNLRIALGATIDYGDPEAVDELTQHFFAVADDPVDALTDLFMQRRFGTEAHLLFPIIESIRDARPADLEWIIEHARVLFADGRMGEARQMMLDALDERHYHRDALTPVVEMLAEENLDVELSRVLATEVPDDSLWPGITIAFAEANFALGFDDEARTWLERLPRSSVPADLWRIELADRLAERQLYSSIAVALEAVDETRVGPYATYLLGVHQLAAGNTETGLSMIRQANEDGVGRGQSHFHAIRAALLADDDMAAEALMDDLTQVAPRDPDIVSVGLRFLLASAMHVDGGASAIRTFLEDRLPRLVDGHGATWTQFAGQLASAFEQTDDPEGAYGFYRDRIWQSLLTRHREGLPIYLNNLAYVYSTTDQHLARGMDKIRRAIVLGANRNASLIDTLAWIHYRKGDLDTAERELRRALRTHDGQASGLSEMLYHLQVVLDEQGVYDRAAIIDTRRHRLPPPGSLW